MKQAEFNQKDAELLTSINQYRDDCYRLEAQIAINNREITRLEQQRVELRHQYIQEEETL